MATELPVSEEMLLSSPGEDSLSYSMITWRFYIAKFNGQTLFCTLNLDNSWTGEDVMRKLRAEFEEMTTLWERLLPEMILLRKPSLAVVKIRSVSSEHEQ